MRVHVRCGSRPGGSGNDLPVRELIHQGRRELRTASVRDAHEQNLRCTAPTITGEVGETLTRESLPIGAGDVIQTRKNNTSIGVANRQNWIVQRVEQDGALRVRCLLYTSDAADE